MVCSPNRISLDNGYWLIGHDFTKHLGGVHSVLQGQMDLKGAWKYYDNDGWKDDSSLKVFYEGVCHEEGIDYWPNAIDIDKHVKSGKRACQTSCQELSTCNFWTFNTNTKMCIRKKTKDSATKVSYAISGPKFCPK